MPTDPKALLAKYQPRAGTPISLDQQLCAVRFSPDGNFLAAGSFEGSVRPWDSTGTSFTELPPLKGHDGWVQCIVFHPDGKRLFSADTWGRVTCSPFGEKEANPLWSVKDAHDGWIHAMAMSSDGKWIATGGRDKTIRLTSPDDGKKVLVLVANEDVLALAFRPDGESLVSGDLKGIIKQWDLTTSKAVREFDAKVMFLPDRIQDVGGVRCFSFSSDGKTLFAGGSQPKSGAFVQGISLILEFDLETGKSKEVYRGATDNEGYVFDMVLHPGGFVMAISSGQPGQGSYSSNSRRTPQPFFLSRSRIRTHAARCTRTASD